MKPWRTCIAVIAAVLLTAIRVGAEGLVIQSRVGSGAWSTAQAVYPIKGEAVVLKVEPLPGYTVRWYRIRPDLEPMYKNANHPWEKDPYQWAGWARIRYQQEEMEGLRGTWTVEPFDGKGDILPSKASWGLFGFDETRWDRSDLGTFWIQAEAKSGPRTLGSPGLEAVGKKGISPEVFRICVREGDGFLGWLTSYFNVPGLFGAVTYQTANYIGSDCADVLMAASARSGGKTLGAEASVAGMVQSLPHVAEFDLEKGRPSRVLTWGRDLSAGDILAVRYAGRRAYQHVGALYADDGDGIFGADDRVLHAGPYPLHASLLKEGAFDGHCLVLKARE